MSNIDIFTSVTRGLANLQSEPDEPHAFEFRNIHPDIPKKVKDLFDDGYYEQATFTACKYLDNLVKKYAPGTKSGEPRMMAAFSDEKPLILLNSLEGDSDRDEQRGYKFIFAGTMIAIRNPRGHEVGVEDDLSTCLDHLSLVSSLIRRLGKAGYKS